MNDETLDLLGSVCPYPVMHVIREVGAMRSGDTRTFMVDDPLAIRSVPEELEDEGELEIDIRPHGRYWAIVVRRP